MSVIGRFVVEDNFFGIFLKKELCWGCVARFFGVLFYFFFFENIYGDLVC